MKKLYLIMFAICLTVVTQSQPIKTQPVRFFFEGYSPQQDCPDCPPKKTAIKPVVKPLIQPVKPATLPPLPEYKVETGTDGVINITITNNNNNANINGNLLPGSETKPVTVIDPIVKINPHALYVPDLWLRKGTAMILSGVGCQLLGLGVWAFSTIDKYEMTSITTTQYVPYKYYTYSLVETSVTGTCEEKCWPTYTYKYKTYQLKEVEKTGLNAVTFTDTSMKIKQQNKNAYYISAGILGFTGLCLEIAGIVDNSKNKIYFAPAGVGYRF